MTTTITKEHYVNTPDPDRLLSDAVRELREALINSGFQHGRRPGELVGKADNGVDLHVRTGYTHGSYRVTAFGRDRGEKQGQVYVDINRGVTPERVIEITRALVDWDGSTWPPHPDMKASTTGQGEGWPPK